jgi:hypothetical protein
MAGLMAVLSSCGRDGNRVRDREVRLEDYLTEEDIFDDIDKAKKIFYSLPSPLETAMLLKSAGVGYNEQVLNDLNKIEKYTTNKSKAINLGIYTTDLSFASLFDQAQTSLNYMDGIRRIAGDMGISDAVDDETLRRLEDNLNNRDVVMDIISETFLNSSSYLKENDQQDIAAIVLTGGWIEGLYIGTQMAGDGPAAENQLALMVAEQKLSLSIVERMLEDNKADAAGRENADVVSLINQLEPLIAAYNAIEVLTSANTVENNEESGTAMLKSETRIVITDEAFANLKSAVAALRNDLVL